MENILTFEELNKMKAAEAARFNTTVENLEESGFFFKPDIYGDCHWVAYTEFGTLMTLAWFRHRQAEMRKDWSKNRKVKTKKDLLPYNMYRR